MGDGLRKPWLVFADEFSWRGWSYEGATRVEPPHTLGHTSPLRRSLRRPGPLFRSALGAVPRKRLWRRILEGTALAGVEFVLIESAWTGFRTQAELVDMPIALAAACRRYQVPAVYWNKEDPFYFDKFLPVALSCDVILTTDANCVDRYREAGFRGIVDVMVFPAQPELHRQYLPKDESKRVFFAGSYRPYPERAPSYEILLAPAVDFGLDIFSRRGEWPPELAQSVVGTLPYTRLLERYSAYAVGLNVSTIKHSPTMFPRRIVEMPLANIFVISDESRAITNLFPSLPQSSSANETRMLLAHFLSRGEERAAGVEEMKKVILENHTYGLEYSRICDRLNSMSGG